MLLQLDIVNFGGRQKHALLDSGFGYSQVLPILVRGLLTPRAGLFVVEQPEVHLNPGLQVRLADFLVSLARNGRQLLVETHSEHIVNALRAITAEAEDSKEKIKCSIFYLEASCDGPLMTKLDIQSDGSVPSLPLSFFGESTQILARLMKAQLKRT